MFDLNLQKALSADQKRLQAISLRQLFQQNPQRFEQMSIVLSDIVLDYSKNYIDQAALNNLLQLAKSADIKKALQKIAAGEIVNHSENLAASHLLLREQFYKKQQTELTKDIFLMLDWAEKIRQKKNGWQLIINLFLILFYWVLVVLIGVPNVQSMP